MLTFGYGKIVLPFYERILHGRKTFRYFRELEKSQWLSREAIDELQLKKLKLLLSYANENCPYYRDEWNGLGLNSANLSSLVDFQKWPLTTRETVTANRSRMRTIDTSMKILTKATGGSSGVPLKFDLSMESHERRSAATYRGYSWAGAGPGKRQFYLWGVALGQRTQKQQFKDRWFERINRRLVANSFNLSRDSVPEYVAKLNAYRPDNIVAYTNALYTFAKEIQLQKLKVFSPKSIVIGAEKLHPFQRELIESVFQTEVFETYGSREVMLMGAECEKHRGLHITSENLVVEVCDEHGNPTPDGQEGNLVITDLTNFGMPFIRYVNGDRAIAGFENCTCGRGLPVLKEVIGRQADIIQTPSGKYLTGLFFPHYLKDFPQIERFLVIQERLDLVRIQLVNRDKNQQIDKNSVAMGIVNYLGNDVKLEIEEVAEIPLTAAGKQRVVVSNISSTAAHNTR